MVPLLSSESRRGKVTGKKLHSTASPGSQDSEHSCSIWCALAHSKWKWLTPSLQLLPGNHTSHRHSLPEVPPDSSGSGSWWPWGVAELRKAEVAVAGRPPGSPRSARLSELQHWRGPPGGVNKRPLPGDHRVSVCWRPRNRHPVSRPRTTDLGTRTEAQRRAVGETITQSQRRSHTPSRRSHPECHTQPPRDTRLGDSPSGFPGSSVQVAPLVCPSPCQGGALCLASEPLTRVPSPLSAQPRYLQ